MFEHPLPTTCKPLKLARQEGKLSGYMPLKQLFALIVDCVDIKDDDRVEAELGFVMEGRRPEVYGQASTQVKLVCQRCLEPVAVSLDVKIALGFTQNEQQVQALPEDLEPFMFEEEDVPLARLLEQELILALPIVAYHQGCDPIPFDGGEDDRMSKEDKPNPFAVLEQLKGHVKKSDS